MSHPSSALRWLTEIVGVYRTSDLVVRVRGEDARSWLNGQVTTDVRDTTSDAARYALALTVKGRIVSDLWALEDAPGMALVLPTAGAEPALQQFEQHIIMEDVELAREPGLTVLSVQGPRAGELGSTLPEGTRRYACARLSSAGFDCWVANADVERVLAELVESATGLGGGAVDEASWAAAHVALGVPRLGSDFGSDAYPQEAGLGGRAMSFSKGCYMGQEVAYMLEKRGQVARRLVQLEGLLEPGAGVADSEGKRVGEVTSIVPASLQGEAGPRALGLAYVKRAFAEPERQVWVAGSPCRVVRVIGS